jgi:hypothetical protein
MAGLKYYLASWHRLLLKTLTLYRHLGSAVEFFVRQRQKFDYRLDVLPLSGSHRVTKHFIH